MTLLTLIKTERIGEYTKIQTLKIANRFIGKTKNWEKYVSELFDDERQKHLDRDGYEGSQIT